MRIYKEAEAERDDLIEEVWRSRIARTALVVGIMAFLIGGGMALAMYQTAQVKTCEDIGLLTK